MTRHFICIGNDKMATVKVKIFYSPNYDRCKVASFTRDDLTSMTFKQFSNEVRQTVGYENSSRIQYRDDESTFVTMNTNEDFEDAVRCICPVMNSENIYRLCIRVDDSVTPKTTETKAKQSVATTTSNSQSTLSSTSSSSVSTRKRKLDFPLCSKSESKPAKSYPQAETPLQRYISNTKRKIEEKMQAKQTLVDEEADIIARIDIAKRQKGKGLVCHNCHMRLGNTARNCTFEQCNSIYSCGEEKLHPAEKSRLKQMRQSISKLENEIGQLNKELENRQAAVDKVNMSKTNRIENELLKQTMSIFTCRTVCGIGSC